MPLHHRSERIILPGRQPMTVTRIEATCDQCGADAPFLIGKTGALCSVHFWVSAWAQPALQREGPDR